ncbi:MAG: hypothetical protein SCM11_15705 [Bacillota bacterium]|nr:hypothetical protein [Bacillota bacterium]
MDTINYTAKVSITPPSGRRGERVALTVTLADVVGEIRQVIMTVPGYDIYQYLSPQGNQVYSAAMTIPWEAPSGTYTLNIYALGPENKRGPVIKESYSVQ